MGAAAGPCAGAVDEGTDDGDALRSGVFRSPVRRSGCSGGVYTPPPSKPGATGTAAGDSDDDVPPAAGMLLGSSSAAWPWALAMVLSLGLMRSALESV